MLDAGAIIAEAQQAAGLHDPEPYLHANLHALVDSLNGDGRLDAVGESAARRSLVMRQGDRLSGLRWMREHPEICCEPIDAPVFLTGLPRSGTTYFQYLFDMDPRFRLVRTWEAVSPSPPPGADLASAAERQAGEAERRRQLRPREVEGFEALHLLDEGGSDECHTFMEQSCSAAGAHNLYDAPDFFDHLLAHADLDAAYTVHKRQLQLLQWRSPRRRWALKYPNHVLAMDAICRTYPDARFAMTHRDPVQTLASIAKLTLRLRRARYAEVDPRRVGRQMLDFVGSHIARILAFAAGPDAARVAHVDYYALLADPAREVGAVHRALGIDTPETVRAAVANWRRANPKNARGANDYALEEFGIRPGEALELYGDYMRRFAIPREAEGLARIGGAAT